MSYESVLCVIKECFIYKIPPRSSANGYRASDWDVNSFLFTGRLRAISTDNRLELRIEDAGSGEVFAKAPIESDGSGCEAVTDSSRYFVIRLLDPSTGKHAYVGLGFQERSYAFDLNVAIQDHIKRLNFGVGGGVAKPTGPSVDYSLKEGQNFTISIGGVAGGSGKPVASTAPQPSSNDFSKFMIPPPPSTSSGLGSNNVFASNANAGWGDDFGSFQQAPLTSTASSTNNNASTTSNNSNKPPSGWTTF